MIDASELSCRYNERAYSNNLSFHITAHLNILGANGSGKSMLARTLCGLLPYSGSLTLNRQELATLTPRTIAQTISYIPAKLELFDRYTTVEEFALLGRYPYKEPYAAYSRYDRDAVQETLTALGLDRLKKRRVTQLSSGQQQLLLIAQALIQSTKIMVFDEPTANLDPYNTLKFATLFQQLQRNHTTVLITHDLALVQHLQGSVLFLHDHTATFYAQTEEFFDNDNLNYRYRVAFHPDTKALLYE